MNDVMRDVTAIVMAIIGVALLTVVVSNRNETANVIRAATGGTATLLSVAMGGAPTAGMGISSQ